MSAVALRTRPTEVHGPLFVCFCHLPLCHVLLADVVSLSYPVAHLNAAPYPSASRSVRLGMFVLRAGTPRSYADRLWQRAHPVCILSTHSINHRQPRSISVFVGTLYQRTTPLNQRRAVVGELWVTEPWRHGTCIIVFVQVSQSLSYRCTVLEFGVRVDHHGPLR